jgi:hypothetical protein
MIVKNVKSKNVKNDRKVYNYAYQYKFSNKGNQMGKTRQINIFSPQHSNKVYFKDPFII